jgi:outer membrane receptor protein involved in Fe transport
MTSQKPASPLALGGKVRLKQTYCLLLNLIPKACRTRQNLAGALVICALFSINPLYAQGNASVVGVVSDSSGAVVPSALVTITNEDTGLRQTATTDNEGRYNFPRLVVGNYAISVSASGFKTVSQTGINLTAEQALTVNFGLEVGQTSEHVQVTGEVTGIETVTSTVRTVISHQLIEDLPLNGRNALQLQTLIPGAVNQTGARVSLSQEDGVSVNGARGNDNNVLLDGGHNNDVYDGTPTSMPNPDALQEFSILSSSFSAEFGRGAGSLVTAVTKSGTNSYHGSVYEYLRNDVLDARSFFGHAALVTKPTLKRNQFGASLGGPIRKDKTFLFFSWESLREQSALTNTGQVMPTAAERQGDFSQSKTKPIDPLTNARFPNDIIPASRFSNAARQIGSLLFPLPNINGNQLIFNAPASDNRNQYVARFDHAFSSRDLLYVSYFNYDTFTHSNAGLPLFNGFNNWTNNHLVGNYTKILSPTVVNTFTYTLNRLAFVRSPDPILPNQFPGKPPAVAPGLRYQDFGVMTTPQDPSFPMSTRLGTLSGYFSTGGNTYFDVVPTAHEIRDTLSVTRGAHSLKFGFEWATSEANRHEVFNADGASFDFGGTRAGNGFAEWLLGLPTNFQQYSTLRSDNLFKTFAVFAQDDWKIAPNFTLNLGLRYEPYFGIRDGNNEIIAYRPGMKSSLLPNAPLGLVIPGDPGIPPATYNKDWNNLAPRVGFAWLPFGPSTKTSVRAAYGVFYNTERGYLLNETQLNQPFVLNVSIPNPSSFESPWANYPGGNPYPFTPPSTPEARAAYQFKLPMPISRYFDPSAATPYNQQWNITLQRELPAEVVVSAAYVGSKGTRLWLNREINPAVYIPGVGPNGQALSTSGNIDARRLNRNFQGIDKASTDGNSTYHSLQVSATRRFSKGLYIMSSYTLSKALDYESLDRNASLPQNPFDLRSEHGPADFDRRHNIVTSFLFEIPSPWKRGVAGRLTNGWRTNGIYRYTSGSPLTVVPGTDRALQGGGNQRVNVAGNPVLSADRSFDQQRAQYFTTAAFALPAIGTFGNMGRNAIYGPGQYNLDLSLMKATRITERATFEIRWELFNAFNHANLGNPNVTFNSSAFGRIDTVTGPRIMQLGAKILF